MIKLYNAHFSPNTMRVRAVAYELGIDLEIIDVNTHQGENRTPAFLAMNPNGKVPTMVDGDFVLWESRAINNYLCRLKPEKNLYPADAKLSAQVDQWCYWQTVHLGPATQKVSFERVLKPVMGRGEPDENAIAQYLNDIDQFLPVLEAQLEGKPWVVGELTVADFTLASTFMLRDKANISLAGFENIQRWLNQIEARPSWQKAVAEMSLPS